MSLAIEIEKEEHVLHDAEKVVLGSLALIPPETLARVTEGLGELSVKGWSNLQEFAYQLVLDGRFHDRLPVKLNDFAQLHNIELPLEMLDWADTVDSEEFLKTMKDIAKGRMEFVSANCPAEVGILPIIAGVVVGDAVITIVALVWKNSVEIVKDSSPEADEKL